MYSLLCYNSPMKSMWLGEFPKNTSPLNFFVMMSRPHWKPALLGIGAVTIGSLLSTSIPYIFKMIADAAVLIPQNGTDPLLFAAILYIGVDMLKELIWRSSGYAGSYWATGARATARFTLTSYLTLHSRAYFSDHFAGSLANKIGHAANGVRDLVEKFLWQFLGFFISLLGSFVLMSSVSTTIGFLFIGWVIVALAFNVHRARRRMPYSLATQKVETALTGATVDLLSNISAMQEYARRHFEMIRIQKIILARRVSGLRNWHFGEWTLIVNGLTQSFFAAGMVLVMISLIKNGQISPGDIILVVTLIYRLDDQFLFLGSHINELSEKWGEIKESLEEILIPHEIADVPEAQKLTVTGGKIVFESARFAYADNVIFPELTLSISPGQRVGLVGKSGAGKSTLVRLLMRQYELSGGAIVIDTQNIREVTQDSLHEAIAVVPQESLLFHRSIAENISYGRPDASLEEIQRASTRAQAHDFIERLPQGYEALVGERGVKLSGGERQRVAIARAILKDAPILILDEATASLDSESELAIQKALHELMEGKTVIAIAHRLSTLREMDRIIVLDKGQIVEDGTHESLLAHGGIYADLWNHQAGGFIPADGE